MKKLFIIVLIFISAKLNAQTNDSLAKKEVYLEIRIGEWGPFAKNSGYYYSVIRGGKYLENDSLQWKFKAKKMATVYTEEGIFEYLNSLGWQLLCAYSIVIENKLNVHYILKKEI